MSAETDFADREFKVECGRMLLTKAEPDAFTVQGPGEIWQDEEGRIKFKIFAEQEGYLKLFKHQWRPIKIGAIYPESDYFTLQAATHSGLVWTAERVLPTASGGLAEGLAKGSLYALVKPEVFSVGGETASVILRFRGKLEFPCNRGTTIETKVGDKVRRSISTLNVAFVDDGDFHFEFYHQGEHTVASLDLPLAEYNEGIADRVHEALQFVLGRQLGLMVVETKFGQMGTTRLVSPDLGKGRVPPPLRFQSLDEGGHMWRLFFLYFRHIVSCRNLGWHPMSRQIAGVVESAAASFEAQMLALGVATEGLAGECFPDLAPMDAEFLAEVERVKTLIEQGAAASRFTPRMADRLKGALDGMREVRKPDILRAFIKQQGIPLALFKSWKTVRNTTAHGNGGGGRPFEESLKLYHETLALFYALVLEKIGYSGPRTDYAAPNFPQASWPVAASPNPDSGSD